MKNVIYILLLTKLAFSQNAKLDTNVILIGEQINLTLSNPLDKTEIWPNYTDFLPEEIEVINALKIDTINNLITQKIIITAWDSGSYYISPIKFSQNEETQGIIINVKTIEIAEDAKLKDIKEPINEPIGWSDIWPFILVVLILILIIYLLKRYVFKAKEKIITTKSKIIIPPGVIALQELDKLEKDKIWQQGNIKEYHTQLSEIIRRYCEDKFKFIALELTTNEILEELNIILTNTQINNLKLILQRADLAKFAKSKPINTENIESMVLAKEFVNSTKEETKNE
tara:strand:+ start:4249 stop:5103 length:855 start_codon:yes stop_codon:yes gene_type:complete